MRDEELYILLCRNNLAAFTRFAFGHLYPAKHYADNWHIKVLADKLEQYARGDIKNLIINLPPRSLKSFCISVAYAAWVLGRYPERESVYIHGGTDLRDELTELVRRLMESPGYQAMFPGVKLRKSDNARDLITMHGGSRKAITLANDLTGRGADSIIIDDPLPASQAYNAKARQKVNQFYDVTVYQRLNYKSAGQTLLVMQRLHSDDLTGHILSKGDDTVVLNLQAIATEDEQWTLSNGKVFTRKKGEALHPEHESRDDLLRCLREIGAYNFFMQYQQGRGNEPQSNGFRSVFIPQNKNPNRPSGFYNVSEIAIMEYEIFGIGDFHPLYVEKSELQTMEEWEDELRLQQRRLMSEIDEDRKRRG